MKRRTFLKAALAAGIGAPARAADAEIEIRPAEPGPTVSPHLYGHFIEHLGGVIYDGIWVGTGSRIANIQGLRRQFVEDMKALGAPNIRWPGGCFADMYHWRDGIGPRQRRPRTNNFWQRDLPKEIDGTESNEFGTHEFLQLCELTGAEPYLAANVGSGSPREFHDWATYCNAPPGLTTLAREREANGRREPFRVKYWGVGNESWGCGGNFKPGEYATLYRRFVTQFPAYYLEPYFIAAGPSGSREDGHLDWTRGFFEGMIGHSRRIWPHGWALHYYTRPRRTPNASEDSLERWYDILAAGARMESLIEDHWRIMGEFDPEHRVKLVVDEWGVWQPRADVVGPRYLFSQVGNLRDALHAALTLDIFNRHADKIDMANIAQTINCIHSLFAAREDRFARTPTFYVFQLYRGHLGGRRIPLRIQAPDLRVSFGKQAAPLFALAGSASMRDGRCCLTLVSPSADEDLFASLGAAGAAILEARGSVLTHTDRNAANSLESPETVKPAGLAVTVSGAKAQLRIPKHSVVALEIRTG